MLGSIATFIVGYGMSVVLAGPANPIATAEIGDGK
jgi:hypothetical protein